MHTCRLAEGLQLPLCIPRSSVSCEPKNLDITSLTSFMAQSLSLWCTEWHNHATQRHIWRKAQVLTVYYCTLVWVKTEQVRCRCCHFMRHLAVYRWNTSNFNDIKSNINLVCVLEVIQSSSASDPLIDCKASTGSGMCEKFPFLEQVTLNRSYKIRSTTFPK